MLLLSRLRQPDLARMSAHDISEHLARTHRVPASPVNRALGFCIGLFLRHGVLQRTDGGRHLLRQDDAFGPGIFANDFKHAAAVHLQHDQVAGAF